MDDGCGDLVYKFKKIMGRTDFLISFKKKTRHKRIGYYLNVMRQYVCLVINTITVDNCVALHAGGSGVRLYDSPGLKLFILVDLDWSFFACCLVNQGSTYGLLVRVLFDILGVSNCHATHFCLCFFIVLHRDLFVNRVDSLTSYHGSSC